jgi:hypothetical protein
MEFLNKETFLYGSASLLLAFFVAFAIKFYLYSDQSRTKTYDRSASAIVRNEEASRLNRQLELERIKVDLITLSRVLIAPPSLQSAPVRKVDFTSLNSREFYESGDLLLYPIEAVEPLAQLRKDDVGRKLLVCHDMAGNYLGDSSVCGSKFENHPYQLTHWGIVDIFVYFSHNFITIPPLSWINCGHRHGAKVLGLSNVLHSISAL